MLEALLAIEWCILRGIPLVVMSESTRDDAVRSGAKEQVKRRIIGMAAAAFVGGGPQADYVAELGMPRECIFLGYNVVDNDHFAAGAARVREEAPAQRALHRLPEHYFFCCARMIEKKNLVRLIEALARYRAAAGAAAWELVVVGPGPLRSEFEDAIALRGLGGAVHLVGARGYADLPIYYGLASAFILPSIVEQWGLVVNEAMASGLPVLVSSRCGCARDLVQEGRNGLTFNPSSIAAMADAMSRIARDDCDRAAMGAASRAIIANWGPKRFAAGFDAAARAALAAPKRCSSVADRLLLRALTWR
jgi:glycosyltransferase involved in cell wall biosynthesis